MKKTICVFVFLFVILFSIGCSEQKNTARESEEQTLVTYENIDDATKQLLTDYMDKINLILELRWTDEYADELRFETEEFKKVLEILYEDSTGQPFPQKDGRARMETYLDTASKFFNLNTGYLRNMLSVYTYDFATDTVQVASDVEAEGILNIKDICQKDGIYEITFNRRYETYDRETDSYKLGNITDGLLKVELKDDGSCIFVSNSISKTEYATLSGQPWETYISLRTYAMGDILNYSWDEENKGSLFVGDNYKAIQHSMERMYRMFNSKDFPATEDDSIERYENYTRKFFDFDKDLIYKTLGVTDDVGGVFPENDYVTDDNHFILYKDTRYVGEYIYVDYTNGIRSYDSHTGRYHLLDAVDSTLVFRLLEQNTRYVAVANINAYYDVQDKERYSQYLEMLAPALETDWDETADNELTNNPQLMKVVLQNIYLKHNWKNKADETMYTLDPYKYSAKNFFVFGLDGLDSMLKKDETYDAESQKLQTAENVYNDSQATIVDVEYVDDYRIVNYNKDGKQGQLTIRVYPDGSEKIAANMFDTRRLTLSELESINNYYRNTLRWQHILTNEFDSPQNIDIAAVVNRLPAYSELTYANYYEVKIRKQAGVQLDFYRLEKGLDEYGRVQASAVDKLLKDTMNITVADLAQKTNYSERYGVFYKTDSYATSPYLQFTDGYIKGDTVTVYTDYYCLTLEKTENKYYIKSFVKNNGKEKKDLYAENGISVEKQYSARDSYIGYNLSAGNEYNNALYEYNEFLAGRRKVNDYKLAPRQWADDGESQVASYGLHDMNNDGIPELILAIPYNVYQIYSYSDDEGLAEWNVKFNGGMSGRSEIFSDGTAGCYHISTGAVCSFYRYDAEGNCIKIMDFSWYDLYDDYKFNGKKVTKEEFEKLADPWMDKFDSLSPVEMKEYLQITEYWQTYADKLKQS